LYSSSELTYSNKILSKFYAGIETLDSFVLGASMIAGFCVRHVKDKHPCFQSINLLKTKEPEATIFNFIRQQDHRSGAQIFPEQKFLELVVAILKFLDSSVSVTSQWSQPKKRLVSIISPRAIQSGRIHCGCGKPEHANEIYLLIITKLVLLYLGNYAKAQSDLEDVPKCHQKQLSRKINKL